MSSSNDDPQSTVPVRTIHGAYHSAIEARREFQQAVGGPMEGWAHQNLHDAVLDYYEVLRPLISTKNATEELWEERKLWPTDPIMNSVAYCPACGGHHPVEQLDETPVEIGEACPACGDAIVETTNVPRTDENGQVVFQWVEGLRAIDELRNQRAEEEHTYSDALGTHTTTRTTSSLLAPEQLTAIARALDDALENLGLLADVDDEVPSTDLDAEDLDKFQEQIAKLKGEFDDDDAGLDVEELDEAPSGEGGDDE